jgi:hypothetical protein
MNYATRGMVSGGCHHVHKTLAEAEACRRKYLAKHPLSDRCVMQLEQAGCLSLLMREEALALCHADPLRHKA